MNLNYCSLKDAWSNGGGSGGGYSKHYYANDNDSDNNAEVSPIPMLRGKPGRCNKRDRCSTDDIENFTNNENENENETENFINNNINNHRHKQNHKIKYEEHMGNISDCDSFLNHIKVCDKCSRRMREYFRSKVLDKLQELVENNKDTIVLILIGISILLIFNLINNLTK